MEVALELVPQRLLIQERVVAVVETVPIRVELAEADIYIY